ncbi:uncharacterized protein LOC135825583 isoform X2 [Sycon ciliatum]|uniref:uncharacterized protein LOC135825583 isoform X2 n=1 Tax=Sycon ciliatum TaxID=27933 RepID=UPI0031F65FD9
MGVESGCQDTVRWHEQYLGPPSAPEDLFVVRLNSTSATINFKAPKQEERVHEYHCSYTSEECGGEGRWVCSRPRVANCTVIGTFFWRYVNESSSLPVTLSDLCAGKAYRIHIRAINDKGYGLYSYTQLAANGSRSNNGTSSSPSSTSSPTKTSSRPSSPSNTTETSSSPSSPSNTTEKPLIILDQPSRPKVINSVRLSSALAAINVKAPKPEDRVAEIYIYYSSAECRGNKRWNCTRPRVNSCALLGFLYWQYVNESSSLPLIVSRLCAGQSYDIYVNAVNEQFTFGPSLWLYVDGNVDGIWPRPSSPSNTAETSSSPPSPSNPTENPLTTQARNWWTGPGDKLTADFGTTQLALGGMMLFSLFLIAMLVCRACRLGTREQRWGTRRCPNPATRSRDFDCVVWRQPSGVESTCNDETQMAVMNRKEEEVEDVLSSGGDLQGSLSSQANSQVHVRVFDPEETSRKDQLQCAQNVSDEDRDRISDTWSAAASIESYVFRNNFLVPELANDGQSLSPTPSVARDCYRPPAPPPTPTPTRAPPPTTTSPTTTSLSSPLASPACEPATICLPLRSSLSSTLIRITAPPSSPVSSRSVTLVLSPQRLINVQSPPPSPASTAAAMLAQTTPPSSPPPTCMPSTPLGSPPPHPPPPPPTPPSMLVPPAGVRGQVGRRNQDSQVVLTARSSTEAE